MEKRIIDIMKRVFQIDDISPQTSQANCEKWDSLHHLNLIVELEEEFDTEFEPEEIAEMKSFDIVKKMISNKI